MNANQYQEVAYAACPKGVLRKAERSVVEGAFYGVVIHSFSSSSNFALPT